MKTAFGILLAACLSQGAGPAFATDSLIAVIQARENQWADAFNANDAERLVEIYESDAVLVAPGASPVSGHAAIGESLQAFFPTLKNLALLAEEVRPLGDDYAVEIGHSTYRMIAADGSMAPGSDNYVVVWHRGSDGVWRYVTDIFNQR